MTNDLDDIFLHLQGSYKSDADIFEGLRDSIEWQEGIIARYGGLTRKAYPYSMGRSSDLDARYYDQLRQVPSA